jgi:hypothetical protein
MNQYRAIKDGADFDKIKIFCGDNFVVAPDGITTKSQISKWVADMVKAQNGPDYELTFADSIQDDDTMTTEQAIEKIKSEKTTFLGVEVNANNYGHEIRSGLQSMAEHGDITPTAYWAALKMTPKPESEALRSYEIEQLGR